MKVQDMTCALSTELRLACKWMATLAYDILGDTRQSKENSMGPWSYSDGDEA